MRKLCLIETEIRKWPMNKQIQVRNIILNGKGVFVVGQKINNQFHYFNECIFDNKDDAFKAANEIEKN